MKFATPRTQLFSFLDFFFKHFLIVSFLCFQQINICLAEENLPITPDGSTNTQVTQTASGVDQINISGADSNGRSDNRFSDFNINEKGQVINNFTGDANSATLTQIGGLVTANPNLAQSGSAKLISIEVTTNNISKFLGYAEIAGPKADLIIANPNGFICSGCGFINTSRLLMVAGSSNVDQNGNLGFNLKEQANPNLYVPLVTLYWQVYGG